MAVVEEQFSMWREVVYCLSACLSSISVICGCWMEVAPSVQRFQVGLLGSFGWDMMNPRCVWQTQGPPREVEGHDVGSFSRLAGEGLSPAFYLPFTLGRGQGWSGKSRNEGGR